MGHLTKREEAAPSRQSQAAQSLQEGVSGAADNRFTRLTKSPDGHLGKIVLVHGCFWDQHPGCRLARTPKSRLDYLELKLRRNQDRDAEDKVQLENLGWQVLTILECETEDAQALPRKLSSFLGS